MTSEEIRSVMTVSTAQDLVEDLCSNLGSAIEWFENNTGLVVSDIKVKRISVTGEDGKKHGVTTVDPVVTL